MNIGVDFGTTYTKITYLDDDDERLTLFEYPKGSSSRKYVPTAVAYPKNQASRSFKIGKTARSNRLKKNFIFCENFKMLLPLDRKKQWGKHGWPSDAPEPAEVVKDYLESLLRSDKKSVEQVLRPIESIVVSVPEIWQREVKNRGAEQLRRIIQHDIGLNLDRLMSEPVCAAAYYAYEHERRQGAFNGNLLVCDMGGGTFDVALCHIHGEKVRVLDFDGNGRRELGLAGVTFDRNAVTNAWHSVHGQKPNIADQSFLELLQKFEEEKVEQTDPDELEEMWDFFQNDPEKRADTPLYNIPLNHEEYDFTCENLKQSFQPIRGGIHHVLQRIGEKAQQNRWQIDRLIIVGGFGQFFLVRHAIREMLKIDYHDEEEQQFDWKMGNEPGIVAYGAALIANGKIDPIEYYPHTIGVRAAKIVETQVQEMNIPIIVANKIPTNSPGTIYFSKDENTGKRQCFTVKVKSGRMMPLPVCIKVSGEGQWFEFKTAEREFPPYGSYYIGVTIDRSNLVTLIFEPVEEEEQSKKREYALGQLSLDLIVEGP